jgi:hypothetical protein
VRKGDVVSDDLDGRGLLAVLLPRARAQAAFDCDALALGEMLGAGIGLAVPGADAEEVRTVAATPDASGGMIAIFELSPRVARKKSQRP